MAMLYVLVFPLMILVLHRHLRRWSPAGTSRAQQRRPARLSEILYAYTSTPGNNGSAFAGLNADTSCYNTLLGLAMLIGRFLMIVPMLALAGILAEEAVAPESAGTFPVTTPAVHGAARRRDRHRRRADVLPGARPWGRSSSIPDAGREALLTMARHQASALRPLIVRPAILDSFVKLTPRHMVRNPVMFVVEVGSVLTTRRAGSGLVAGGPGDRLHLQIALWLWFTVLFANFAEAMAEGRGKAQADACAKTRQETLAKQLSEPGGHARFPDRALQLRSRRRPRDLHAG